MRGRKDNGDGFAHDFALGLAAGAAVLVLAGAMMEGARWVVVHILHL
jgi:hypothetical protein